MGGVMVLFQVGRVRGLGGWGWMGLVGREGGNDLHAVRCHGATESLGSAGFLSVGITVKRYVTYE